MKNNYGNQQEGVSEDLPTGVPTSTVEGSRVTYGTQRPVVTMEQKLQDLNLGEGIGLSGAVKGLQAAQAYDLAQHKDNRDEQMLGINKVELGQKQDYLKIAQEELGIKYQDVAMRQRLSDDEHTQFGWKAREDARTVENRGKLNDAVAAGGYSGGIDFLKSVDPEKAIEFHAKKLALDSAMMSNSVMRELQPSKIGAAKLEAFAVMGKVGTAISGMKPEDQQPAWEAMRHIADTVAPGAFSADYLEAAPLLTIGAMQGVPADSIYRNKGIGATSQSTIGKIQADLAVGRASGLSDADPRQSALIAASNTYELRNQQAALDLNTAELRQQGIKTQTANTIFDNTDKFNSNVAKASKTFIDSTDTFTSIQAQLNVLQKDPSNSAAQGAISRLMASAVQKGLLTDRDVSETVISEAGFGLLMKTYGDAWLGGTRVNLTPREIKNLAVGFDATMDMKLQKQLLVEKQFKDQAIGYGNIINGKNIVYPSSIYTDLKDGPKIDAASKRLGFDQYPPDMQKQMVQAIDAGKSPSSVKQMADQLMKSQPPQQ